MKKIKKCTGFVEVCSFAYVFISPVDGLTFWHSCFSPQTATLVCHRKPQDTSPVFVLDTHVIPQRTINSIDCFLSYSGDSDYILIIFKICVA